MKQDLKETDKVQPQVPDIENKVLGIIMLYPERLDFTVNLMIPECFYTDVNQMICKAIFRLHKKNSVADIMTVTNELRKLKELDNVGGPYGIMKLTQDIGTDMLFEHYVLEIVSTYVKREIIRICNEIQKKAYDLAYDPQVLIDEAIEELFKANEIFAKQNTNTIKSIRKIIEKELEDSKDNNEKFIVKTGIDDFDSNVDIKPKKLMFISALEKAGKTKNIIKFCTEILKNNKDNISIKMWLMETPESDLYIDIAASMTGFNTDYIISKKKKIRDTDMRKIKKEMDFFETCDIEFDFEPETITQISMKASQFVRLRKDKLNIIIIDNYNICRDLEKGSFTDKELNVCAKLQQLKGSLNKKGYKATVIVVDHISPNSMIENAKKKDINLLETGYRIDIDDAGGSVRKRQIVDQFIVFNRPGMHEDLINTYGKKKIVLNGKMVRIQEYLESVTIIEILRNRRGSSKKKDCVIRILFDLGTMQYSLIDIKDVNDQEAPYKERNITQIDEVLFKKDMWKKDWVKGDINETMEVINRRLNPSNGYNNEWKKQLTFDYLLFKWKQYTDYWNASKGQWDVKFTVGTKHERDSIKMFVDEMKYMESFIMHKTTQETKTFDYLGIPY